MLGYVSYVVSLMEHCRNPLWGSSDNQAFPYFPIFVDCLGLGAPCAMLVVQNDGPK